MSDPLKTMSEAKTMCQATSKAMLPRALFTAGALALTFGLFAASAPAGAAPMQALPGLANSGVTIDVGYRRHRNSWLYSNQAYGPEGIYAPESSYRTYRVTPYSQQSDEIRELRRLFPETNWPPSDRY